MTPLSLAELRELAPGYVMQTLTTEELASFEQALRDPAMAEELELELEVCRAATEYLATSQGVAPPPALRDRLVERIARESAQGASPALPPSPTPVPGIISWWVPGGLAVALAASAVLAVSLQRRVGALRDELAQREALLTSARGQLASSDSVVRALTEGGNDLRLVRLSPSQPAGPTLQLFWNVRRGSAVIHASGLAPVAADRAYVLWMIRDGKPVAVALFKPEPNGTQLVRDVRVPTSTEGVAAFAVTEEPATGSPQPTMTPFLVGSVAAQ